ncbi:hypothetical protein [Sandarakinorhabdus sp.]|uniref:hypothetical protein n=1 Tax=Sandarakinorhabdus sp. TaxID=1916663 RepID=UPI00286E8CC0|nr:hypothetical protein [Sandarakinorhabdus sp.]
MRALILTGLLLAAAAPAFAAENRVVTCDTWRARAAGSPGGPALVANVPRSMTPIDLNAVQFTDRKLGRTVIVEAVQAARNPSDGLKIFARFVNCKSKPVTIQVRTNFLDANQIPTENPSGWRTIFLSPRATAGYEENSIGGARVAAFYVELRPNL